MLFGGTVSEQEIALFSPYTHFGDLGVANHVDFASLAFQSSHEDFTLLVDAIVNHGAVFLADHLVHPDLVHADVMKISISIITFFFAIIGGVASQFLMPGHSY